MVLHKKGMFCFNICHQHQTRAGKIKADKAQQILVKAQVFFKKNWTTTYLTTTPCKSIYPIFVNFFSEISNQWKINIIWIFLTWNWQIIRDWREIMQENMIHFYDVTIVMSQGCNSFQLFHLRKTTRNYYMPVTCYHVTLVII